MNRFTGFGLLLASPVACAANSAVFVVASVPSLGDAGLAGLIVLVGAIGGWIARRRK